ncbi:hypothetical protein, partial [Corallococcus terminator]|uniref:hypothetical protein n=1 Tax=Corallococcus terminator TaxID=2316733 RepID=UPI001ABFE017
LQLQFESRLSCAVVALHGHSLVVASPATPGQDMRKRSHHTPQERHQKPSHFLDGVADEGRQ